MTMAQEQCHLEMAFTTIFVAMVTPAGDPLCAFDKATAIGFFSSIGTAMCAQKLVDSQPLIVWYRDCWHMGPVPQMSTEPSISLELSQNA